MSLTIDDLRPMAAHTLELNTEITRWRCHPRMGFFLGPMSQPMATMNAAHAQVEAIQEAARSFAFSTYNNERFERLFGNLQPEIGGIEAEQELSEAERKTLEAPYKAMMDEGVRQLEAIVFERMGGLEAKAFSDEMRAAYDAWRNSGEGEFWWQPGPGISKDHRRIGEKE